MKVLHLYNEKLLIRGLQAKTIVVIRNCEVVEPIKKLLECYDILDLTLNISNNFPTVFPNLPECDEGALLHLDTLLRELAVYYGTMLPTPEFPSYKSEIKRLLTLYQIPRGKLKSPVRD